MSTRKRVSQACKPCNQKKIKVGIASERVIYDSSNFDHSATEVSHNVVHAGIRVRSVHMGYQRGGLSLLFNVRAVADFATEDQTGGQSTMG